MSHARRTLIAAGAAFATGLAGLTLAPTTAQVPRRRGRAVHHEDADQPGLRRRGHLGRPRGQPDRPRRAQARRERRRRGRRDRRRPGRHRAVQRGHRRGRLLRLLRRGDRPGAARSTVARPRPQRCRTTRSSTRRPASPTASPRSWSPAASRSVRRERRPPGTPRWTAGGAGRCSRRCSPRRDLARSGFVVDDDLPPADPGQRGALRRLPRHQQALPARRRTPRRSARSSATPTSRTTYRLIAKQGTRGVLPRRARRRDRPDRAAPAEDRRHRPCPSRPGYLSRSDLGRLPASSSRRRPTSDYRGLDVYGMAPSSQRRLHRRRGAEHPRELRRSPAMTDAEALHHYLEASALAFADRGKYVGDPAYVDVPLRRLLSRQVRRRAGLPDRPGATR